jgi:ADP-ribose pyrophosphatase YjhB (NUDIX family)
MKYCSNCGTPFSFPVFAQPSAVPVGPIPVHAIQWPLHCAKCGEYFYHNPKPVVVALIPVLSNDGRLGLIIQQRRGGPVVNGWALPAGYLETSDGDWRKGLARESLEEVNVSLRPEKVRLTAVYSSTGGLAVLIFGISETFRDTTLPRFLPNRECAARKVIYQPQKLCFPSHTKEVFKFFRRFHSAAGVPA